MPYEDLLGDLGTRNWDSERRRRDLEADGQVAEVLFPNTVPPFFPKVSLAAQPPAVTAADMEQRWAGLQAHNRWLADFCDALPGRRAGIAQITLHDVEASVAEIRWAHEAGLRGGVLLPGTPPGIGLPQLYDAHYEPLFRTCAELGVPINHHAGSAAPPMGDTDRDAVVFMLEVTWWAHRALTHLMIAGVFERYPDLQMVFTEQGQCHVGASFIRPMEMGVRHQVGVDRIMWGSDYPHKEASSPYSREAIALAFAGVPKDEAEKMLSLNAAALYGFDLDQLRPIADRIGPRVDEVFAGLPPRAVPRDANMCPAFAGYEFAAE